MNIYTYNILDIKNNTIVSCNKTYESIDDIIISLNYEISLIIEKEYGILLNNNYLFNYMDSDKNISNEIEISKNKILLIVKTEYTIDFFIKEINRGYLYNNENIKHIYKFVINLLKHELRYSIPISVSLFDNNRLKID